MIGATEAPFLRPRRVGSRPWRTMALVRRLLLLAGPGFGKTAIIARYVTALHDQPTLHRKSNEELEALYQVMFKF